MISLKDILELVGWLASCVSYLLLLPSTFLDDAKRKKKEAITGQKLGDPVRSVQNPALYAGLARIWKELEDKGNVGD